MKKSTPGITQWIPEFIYWNLRLISIRWEQPQSTLIEQAVLDWMNEQKLKTQDYFKENPDELKVLISKHEQHSFRDLKYSLKKFKIRRISVPKKVALNLLVSSYQTQRPMSGLLTESLMWYIEKANWIFLSEESAKELVLDEKGIYITGELVDGQEAKESEDIFTKLWNKLEAKGLLQDRKKYTYDDLLVIQSQSEQEVELSPEAVESFNKIKSLLKGGDQE